MAAAAVIAGLFLAYLRLSRTVPENADEANILLMAWDMLHGNLVLHGWYMSDVSFYTTELPQYAVLESFLGLHTDTAHVAAAMTYTLALLLAVLVARGRRSRASRQARAVRALAAAGIMVAPQLGGGVFAVDLSVGHIGTSVPLMLVWLMLDRTGWLERGAGRSGPAKRAGTRWYVPVLTAAALAWILVADPLTLLIGILPLAFACAVRALHGLPGARLPGAGLPGGIRSRWRELSLFAAAGAAVVLAWAAERVLAALGGYTVNPVGFTVVTPGWLSRISVPALSSVPLVFGADFRGLGGVQSGFAVLHVVGVALVTGAVLRVLWRFARFSLIEQVLAVAVAVNVAAYALTTASHEGAHEIAAIVPFGAVLAARMLAGPGAVAWPGRARDGLARAAGRAAGAVVLAGYLAGLAYGAAQPPAAAANAPLAAWLAGHGLRYGLGGYWQSSIVTVESGGQVKVRALAQYSLRPDLWMAQQAWYDQGANRATFIVLDATPGFTSHWEPRPLIREYFGRPDRTYSFGPYSVLVWHRNLLPLVPRPGAIPPPPRNK